WSTSPSTGRGASSKRLLTTSRKAREDASGAGGSDAHWRDHYPGSLRRDGSDGPAPPRQLSGLLRARPHRTLAHARAGVPRSGGSGISHGADAGGGALPPAGTLRRSADAANDGGADHPGQDRASLRAIPRRRIARGG